MELEDQRHIIDVNREEFMELASTSPAKKAAKSLLILSDYIKRFRSEPVFTCAVIEECVLAIVEGKEV
jgi:hypothetical protein